MIRFLHSLADVLFPPRDTETAVRNCRKLKLSLGQYAGVAHLSIYSDTNVQAAITENKFHRNALATILLSQLLSEWCESRKKNYVYIPIPLGTKRQRERGYNQVSIVLKKAGVSIEPRALTRSRETLPQMSLKREERIHNVSNVFTVHPNYLLPDTSYILIDDVVTTGATLNAARASLVPHLPSGSSVSCLALSH